MSFEKKKIVLEDRDRKYAREMGHTAELYAKEIDLYDKIARSLASEMPSQEHTVHLDCGCGTGELLLALAKTLRERGVEHFSLIGVDTNRYLLEEAEKKAASIDGLSLTNHIFSYYVEDNRGKVTHIFDPHYPTLDALNPHKGGQIILVQDDLRNPRVISQALSRVSPNRGLTSMSFTLPGLSQSMALEELSERERINERDLLDQIYLISFNTRTAVYNLAAQKLAPNGVVIETSRIKSSATAEELEKRIKADFPKFLKGDASYLDLQAVQLLGNVDEIEAKSALGLRNVQEPTISKKEISLLQTTVRRNSKPY